MKKFKLLKAVSLRQVIAVHFKTLEFYTDPDFAALDKRNGDIAELWELSSNAACRFLLLRKRIHPSVAWAFTRNPELLKSCGYDIPLTGL